MHHVGRQGANTRGLAHASGQPHMHVHGILACMHGTLTVPYGIRGDSQSKQLCRCFPAGIIDGEYGVSCVIANK